MRIKTIAIIMILASFQYGCKQESEIIDYGRIVDSVYSEMRILKKDSDLDEHCEWLDEYVTKIEKRLEETNPKIIGRMKTIGFTKINEKFYAILNNHECKEVHESVVSEKVKLTIEGINACAKPNDPNLIRPNGYNNSWSKFHPKFKETPCYVETWYK